MSRTSTIDLTVRRCSVCGGEEFYRHDYYAEPDDPIATEFADCLTCAERYLYKRPALPPPPRASPPRAPVQLLLFDW